MDQTQRRRLGGLVTALGIAAVVVAVATPAHASSDRTVTGAVATTGGAPAEPQLFDEEVNHNQVLL
jgi:hypothetical protein